MERYHTHTETLELSSVEQRGSSTGGHYYNAGRIAHIESTAQQPLHYRQQPSQLTTHTADERSTHTNTRATERASDCHTTQNYAVFCCPPSLAGSSAVIAITGSQHNTHTTHTIRSIAHSHTHAQQQCTTHSHISFNYLSYYILHSHTIHSTTSTLPHAHKRLQLSHRLIACTSCYLVPPSTGPTTRSLLAPSSANSLDPMSL